MRHPLLLRRLAAKKAPKITPGDKGKITPGDKGRSAAGKKTRLAATEESDTPNRDNLRIQISLKHKAASKDGGLTAENDGDLEDASCEWRQNDRGSCSFVVGSSLSQNLSVIFRW